MLNILKNEANRTVTLNGAATYESTGSHCLDLFASIGSIRELDDKEIWERFYNAFCEDKSLAMKILFYARDIRGGLGERSVFRKIIKKLADTASNSVSANIGNIPEFGRYDDLLGLLDSPCKNEVLRHIKNQLQKDLKYIETTNISLLAKWLPSVNAANKNTIIQAKRLAKALDLSEKKYRQDIVKLRAKIKIIENNLRQRDYSFDYTKQPSKAMFKYRFAFMRNDKERYFEFLEKVQKGEAKINTGTIYPYEIASSIISRHVSDEMKQSLDTTWNALPDYTRNENALVVVDGSGSMYCSNNPSPISVALSLGIYFAERNKGKFHNHFITFSSSPKLIEIKGQDIVEKVKYCTKFNEIANTNIQKVFMLVLKTAVKNNLSQDSMPDTIYIISDMEFDECTENADLTNFEYAKKKFHEAGYKLPKLVFWNVHSWQQQVPVMQNEQGVVLVSGCTPKIFEMVMEGETSPYAFMMRVLGSERYKKIAA